MTIRNSAATRWALSRRGLLAGVGGVGLATAAGPAAARRSDPHALADFYAKPATRGVALSPSGERIAIIRELLENGQRRTVLDLVDAADPARPAIRSPLGDVECEFMEWANDERVLVGVALKTRTGRDNRSASSFISSEGVEIISRRMLSIDPATGGAVALFGDDRQRMRRARDLGAVIDLLHDDPDHVLMASTTSLGVYALYKVNVRTGVATEVERGDNDTVHWETQAGVPVIRYDVNLGGTVVTVHGRAPGERGWRMLRRVRVDEAPDFAFVTGTDRPGVLIVSARQDGEDVESIRELDLRTFEFGPPMSSRPGSDVTGGLLDDRGRYLGAAFWKDRLEYDFVSPELSVHHRAMNRFFDNACNVELLDVDAARNRFVTYVSGPREPGAWYLYDRAARSYVNLAQRTALDSRRLGAAEAVQVETRDGAGITAYLTAPPGSAPGPLIVLSHGGPESRDRLDWARQAQVLAAQGWWVLQPNFRGSGGYGLAFAAEGWGRWGERMQEDIEDAVARVVSSRGLDRDRVAIMGASYGGYAALMGAVRRPDLYKAAIGIAGVYDLPDFMDHVARRDDSPGREAYEFWTRRIGEPGTDAARLAGASPRRRAGDVSCPVLLVHGVDDAIVPVFQSRRMRDALQAAGKTVDYREIPDAGHGGWEDEVEQEMMGRCIALLRRVFA
ncbi:alpha/beta hydrolase family protein [Brevundimonas sp.]|uniref:alpha/beta hydrolase family protein n=1 Tax=Brevundimonas sp. TaxID=1871086 RepID=UPI002D130BFD|nr:alpha/beta fold hydrolase [Brevundimonas sp.]HWQ86007.1 alpha/beta fold hydrolase [Brevundimonas sp.]